MMQHVSFANPVPDPMKRATANGMTSPRRDMPREVAGIGRVRVIFRCDAATLPEIGSGHVKRCLHLADAMVSAGLCRRDDILFATRTDGNYEPGGRMVREAGYRRLGVADGALEPDAESGTLAAAGATHVIFDRLATAPATVGSLRAAGKIVVSLDDPGPGRDCADLAVNSIMCDLPEGSRALAGYAYLIRPDGHSGVGKKRGVRRRAGVRRKVFASFGGWDARDLAGHLLRVWHRVAPDADLDLAFAELDGHRRRGLEALARRAGKGAKRRIRIHIRPPSFARDLANADLAVVAGGLTALDAAALGTPAIGLPQYPHQLETLRRLQALGTLIIGSDGMRLSEARLAHTLVRLLSAPGFLRRMGRDGRRAVDGKGTARVIDALRPLFTDAAASFRGGGNA